MVTVRTFSNSTEAALAKTLLDDCEIPCALMHENANSLYPLAVPIRLMVSDDQAVRAERILAGQLDDVPEIETSAEISDAAADRATSAETANRNPWELLMLAFYLLVPAVCLLATRFPLTGRGSWIRYLIVRAHVTQFLGLLEIILAALLIAFYFRLRRSRGEFASR